VDRRIILFRRNISKKGSCPSVQVGTTGTVSWTTRKNPRKGVGREGRGVLTERARRGTESRHRSDTGVPSAGRGFGGKIFSCSGPVFIS